MTFRTLLITKAIVCLVFGVFLLLLPGWLFGMLGATLGAAGTFAAREYGAALFGILILMFSVNRDCACTSHNPAQYFIFK